ncbi:hypothetical protein CDV49_17850 [Haematobacter genomosp. 1]|uniref:Uncharacterized protein n=1 Tax=Haematobacter genomosp. 1 TaxID=366618 RepID=A0A212A771_9RHOB|nr:hypothetical protein CDV49_17850 [Haematobacter genomosp. 1]
MTSRRKIVDVSQPASSRVMRDAIQLNSWDNVTSGARSWRAPKLMAYTASKDAVMAAHASAAQTWTAVTTVTPEIMTTPSTHYVIGAIVFLLGPDPLVLTGRTLPANNRCWSN